MPNAGNESWTRRLGLSNTALTLVIVLVAVGVFGGVLLFDRTDEQRGGQPGGAAPGGDPVAADVLRKPDSNTLVEAPDGKVTVVEFLDYQCPACAGFYENITKKLEKDYEGRITFVTRNFPLTMHPLAEPAARAAEAAAKQGKYREMYHALYDNYESWARTADGGAANDDLKQAQTRFDAFAREIGLNLGQFHRDMDSEEVQRRIERDQADGVKAGVEGTPTFFVNGEQFVPRGETFADVDRQLRELIDKELAQ